MADWTERPGLGDPPHEPMWGGIRRYQSADLSGYAATLPEAAPPEPVQPWRSIRQSASSADRPQRRPLEKRISFVLEKILSDEGLEKGQKTEQNAAGVSKRRDDSARETSAAAFVDFFRGSKTAMPLVPVQEAAETPAHRADGVADGGPEATPTVDENGEKEQEAVGSPEEGNGGQGSLWHLWSLQSHLQTNLSTLVASKERKLAAVRREAAEQQQPRSLASSGSFSRCRAGARQKAPGTARLILTKEIKPELEQEALEKQKRQEVPGSACKPVDSAADHGAAANAGPSSVLHGPPGGPCCLYRSVPTDPDADGRSAGTPPCARPTTRDVSTDFAEASEAPEGAEWLPDSSSSESGEFPDTYHVDPRLNLFAPDPMGLPQGMHMSLDGSMEAEDGHMSVGSQQKKKPGMTVMTSLPQGQWDTQGWAPNGEELTPVEEKSTLTISSIESEELIKVSEIGRGQTGSVFLCQWKGVPVAMKEWHELRDEINERMMMREAETLAALRHPCVISLYGTVGDSASPAHVVEFMRGRSLKAKLHEHSNTGLDPRVKASIALQACRGMEFLHSRSIIHFDLKCDNLLCDLRDLQMPEVKIGDMGLSKRKLESFVSGNMRGTLPWMAPELLPTLDGQPCGKVNEKIDVYSFGVCLWEIWTNGAEPYPHLDSSQLMYGLMSDTLHLDMSYEANPDWVDLIHCCMNRDPAQRPTFTDIAWKLEDMLQDWSKPEEQSDPSIATASTWTSSNWVTDLPVV